MQNVLRRLTLFFCGLSYNQNKNLEHLPQDCNYIPCYFYNTVSIVNDNSCNHIWNIFLKVEQILCIFKIHIISQLYFYANRIVPQFDHKINFNSADPFPEKVNLEVKNLRQTQKDKACCSLLVLQGFQ